jgi:hypothetical protein
MSCATTPTSHASKSYRSIVEARTPTSLCGHSDYVKWLACSALRLEGAIGGLPGATAQQYSGIQQAELRSCAEGVIPNAWR